MKIITAHENRWQYTKICVPIFIHNAPTDHESNSLFFDVDMQIHSQDNCYIGTHFIQKIRLQRISNADKIRKATWLLEIVLPTYKNEDEVLTILDECCHWFSLEYIKSFAALHNTELPQKI